MAIKEISYSVSAAGISPATEQHGGTQSEHRAVKLIFNIDDELRAKIAEQSESGKAVYRFDAYDGEGGLVPGAPRELGADTVPEFYLEKWLTHTGGRLRIYLVITAIVDGNTELELYSFPAKLVLDNLPNATLRNEADSLESVSAVAQSAKEIAQSVRDDADAGKFKGDTGDTGPQGEQGEPFTYEDFTDEQLAALKGDRGYSGVYVGSGDMPEGYNVQIDPDGDTVDMSTLATKQYVDEEIATFDFIKVVDALPDTGLPNKIYLVPRDEADGNNLFDEYIWANSAWEFITTKVVEVDLTNYPTKDELSDELDTINQSITDMSVDYITERGTTGIWTWEKWNSGKAVCWGTHTYGNVSISTDWGSMFNCGMLDGINYPNDIGFIEPPFEQITVNNTTALCWVGKQDVPNTTTKSAGFTLIRPSSATASYVAVDFYAVGKWR